MIMMTFGVEDSVYSRTYTFVDALELVNDVYNGAQDPSPHTFLPISRERVQVQFGQPWKHHYSLSSFSLVDSAPRKGPGFL